MHRPHISGLHFALTVIVALAALLFFSYVAPFFGQIAPGVPPAITVSSGLTASTTQTQGEQLLTATLNEIATVANVGDVATLQLCRADLVTIVRNNGANRVQLFPTSGDAIGNLGVDVPYPLAPGETVELVGRALTQWMIASTTASGAWRDVSYVAGDYTANGAMTWTVEAGDVLEYRYMIVGRTMFVSWFFDNTSVGGTLNNTLRVAVPAGYEIGDSTRTLYRRRESAAFAHAWMLTTAGDAFFQLRMFDNANWASSTNATDVEGSAFFPIVVP